MVELHHNEETIIAQATPKGSGALAIIRLSGIDAFDIATCISSLPSEKKLCTLETHTIHFGWVVDKHGKHIDQVLFLIMKAPHTFTGQDTIEITCHNNPFIIEQIIHAAITNGARPALQGEFTKRAVLNNKIDLLQAEAINELIHAQTQKGLKHSLSQIEGTLSHWVIHIEHNLLKALTLSEASFEFIDEEMNFDKQIKEILNTTITTIKLIKKNYNYQKQIKEGIHIALIGSVNAGKSSLFNTLLGQQRAIVNEVAGTTRDIIEAGLPKDGNYWTFVDTAGLRITNDTVEQEGIRRSMLEAGRADIILLLYDGSRKLSEQERKIYDQLIAKHNDKIIIIGTKSDLGIIRSPFDQKSVTISTKTKKNIDQLEEALTKKVTHLFDRIESPFLLNQRQYQLIILLEQKLGDLQAMLCPPVQYELISHHLKDSISVIGELTGKSISQKAIDQLFRQFCVGK